MKATGSRISSLRRDDLAAIRVRRAAIDGCHGVDHSVVRLPATGGCAASGSRGRLSRPLRHRARAVNGTGAGSR